MNSEYRKEDMEENEPCVGPFYVKMPKWISFPCPWFSSGKVEQLLYNDGLNLAEDYIGGEKVWEQRMRGSTKGYSQAGAEREQT